ncbi:unnamed protein product [Urochloa humidicola]
MGRRAAQHGVRCGRVGSDTNLLPSHPPPPPLPSLPFAGSDRIRPTTHRAPPPPQVSTAPPSPPARRSIDFSAPLLARPLSLAVGFCFFLFSSSSICSGNGSSSCLLPVSDDRLARISSHQRTRSP